MVLLIVVGLAAIYALSSTMYAGSQVVFSYAVPSILEPVTRIFRSSGRFIWPLTYVMTVGPAFLLMQASPTRFVRTVTAHFQGPAIGARRKVLACLPSTLRHGS